MITSSAGYARRLLSLVRFESVMCIEGGINFQLRTKLKLHLDISEDHQRRQVE
jgi:hypothetical protein